MRDGEGGQPILTRYTFIVPDAYYQTDYQLEAPAYLPPDTEFTLSAFGLPEPKGIVWDRPSRWYLWFIAAAVLALAVAGYLRYRSQRRTKLGPSNSAPSPGAT